MKPDTPKPTPAEKKFDRAQEEAFSNEGAPPPARGLVAANADPCGDNESRAVAAALAPQSTEHPVSACEPTDENEEDTPAPDVVSAKDAARALPSNDSAAAGVCSLSSAKVRSRGR